MDCRPRDTLVGVEGCYCGSCTPDLLTDRSDPCWSGPHRSHDWALACPACPEVSAEVCFLCCRRSARRGDWNLKPVDVLWWTAGGRNRTAKWRYTSESLVSLTTSSQCQYTTQRHIEARPPQTERAGSTQSHNKDLQTSQSPSWTAAIARTEIKPAQTRIIKNYNPKLTSCGRLKNSKKFCSMSHDHSVIAEDYGTTQPAGTNWGLKNNHDKWSHD